MTDIVESPAIAEPLAVSAAPALIPPQGRARPAALLHGRGLVGLILVGLIFAAGLLAPLIAPYRPTAQLAGANLVPAGLHHLFGTDEVDRDIFSRVLYGIRVDVIVVFVAVPIGALVGLVTGVLATIVRPADVAVQRAFDVILAFPPIILAIGFSAVLGTGLVPILIVVAAVEVPIFGRLVRSSILKVRELPFVQAAEVIGAGRWSIMWRHILPNAAEPLLVQLALSMSVAIFLESAMSFIGIGVRPPQPSLGNIIAGSVSQLSYNAMYAVGPLVVVGMLVLGFQLIAQAIGARRRSLS